MSISTELSLAELRKNLDQGKFSSTELAHAYLSAIDRNKDLNCFITVEPEKLLVEAAEADKQIKAKKSTPLLGIPIAVKDIISTKGTRTTAASKIMGEYVPPYDATVVKKLREAGALILGKTNQDEFAMGSSNENSYFGNVRNPWDKERVPGGSSGGSAAAVAARIAPASLGTDTGGSIRQPASLCNIVGIKPTYGRVSRYGVFAFASSLDQVGPFASNVRDAAIMTQVISGHDSNDSTSMNHAVPDLVRAVDGGVKGVRIGVPKEYFIGGLDKEVESSVRLALSELVKLGAELVEISLPHTEAALSVYYIIAPAEASSNLARYDGVRYGYRVPNPEDLIDLYSRTRGEGFGSEVKRRIMIGAYVLSAGYFDAYYLRAQKVRTLIARDFSEAFEKKCDVIACPASPTTAFKIGEKSSDPLSMYLSDVFTIPVNLAGLPGMSIPCGFDSKSLPIGLQLIGKPFDEARLFQVAGAYEAVTKWHTMRPK